MNHGVIRHGRSLQMTVYLFVACQCMTTLNYHQIITQYTEIGGNLWYLLVSFT